MFCDMVGSSALSTRLDPEEQGDVIAEFHACCANEITSLGGMVAQYLGDGVLAYFGYPTAHENDAERAILAGLAILKAVGTLKSDGDVALQIRIAIGSGVVVVGDLIRQSVTQENAAIGETTNLVARLQAIAEPNSIVISPVTHRLVGALFDYRDLGRHTLKGFAQPVRVRQVLGVSKVESRFEAQHQAGIPPLLGREEELELLLRRWEEAKRAEGRVVLLTGESGIGKSRLTRALQERFKAEPHTPLSYYCSPNRQNSALHPVIGQLLRAAGIERDDTAELRLNKLEALLAQSGEMRADDLSLFAALLSIPGGTRYPPPNLQPRRLKERIFGALQGQLKRLSAREPVLIVFEDLQWIDAASLELLSLAIEQIRSLPILLLATSRREFAAPWPSHSHISTVSLRRLSESDAHALVAGVTKGKSLPPEVLGQIVARTDGVPLFIEELTKAVLESGMIRETGDRYELTGPLSSIGIPSTLHASLLARLDRLAPIQDVAHIGATIGREFSYSLIAAVSALPERDLQSALARLVAAQLVFQRGAPPEAIYWFKHALVQDAAYSSLVRSRRQQLHGLIARALEERFPDLVATEPEIVAQHFTRAGHLETAIDYWLKAASRALERSANVDAAKHISQGLELVIRLPASPKATRKEVALHYTLGLALIAIKGGGAPETLDAFLRARAHLSDANTVAERVSVFRGLWNVHQNRAEFTAACEVAEQCLALVAHDEKVEALANRLMGASLWNLGSFVDARRYLQRCVDLSKANKEVTNTLMPDNQGVALAVLCRPLWLLGYPKQAAAAAAQSVLRARCVGHALTVGLALSAVAYVGTLANDPNGVAVCADELMAHSVEHGLADYEHTAQFYHGVGVALRGDPRQAIEMMRNAMAKAEKIGSKINRVWHVSHLAAAHAGVRDPLAGIALLDEAIQASEKTGGRNFEAELHRLRAEMLLTLGRNEEADASLQRALNVARRQHARWWELRAAATLARVWRDQNRASEARELLALVYSWFTEGLDLPDLRGVRALLDELSPTSPTLS
jgi:class 3 adenylate cyclase/tetratricopeptide (TPR) repeat protein